MTLHPWRNLARVSLCLLALVGALPAQGGAQLTLSAAPVIGTTVQLQLTAPTQATRPFLLALSLTTTPGIPVGPGLTVPLSWDALFDLSLASPGLFGLSTNTGVLSATGTATISWNLPPSTSLVGFTVHAAYVTVNPATGAVAAVSSALPVTFEAVPTGTAPPAPIAPTIPATQNLPGFVLTILQLTGGSGAFGNFQPGDTITVRFKAAKANGTLLTIPEIDDLRFLVSGPTTNYQRVIASQSDVRARAVLQPDGSYLYSAATPIPTTYLAPLNDSPSFGPGDGELTGQALLAGTYTVGMTGYKAYVVEGITYRDSDNAVSHFNIGPSPVLAPRQVVTTTNCNECHTSLMAHGRSARKVEYCLLCHTSGSEDRNIPAVLGGTPAVSVDFRVMIHKIHNAKHLPSVLGVGTNADGSRNYAATAAPLEYVGFQNSIIDVSHVGWPIMPSAYAAFLFDTTGTNYLRADGNGPMPKDLGFGALTAGQKYLEDQMRTGAVQCDACHGGAAQGDLHKAAPSRRACGSCHDDIDWTKPYTANGTTMPAQADDNSCLGCHAPNGGSLPTQESHLHPYSNPALNTGINLHVLGVSGGTGGGRHLLGDPITVAFDVKNDAGIDIPLHQTARGQAIVIGPTTNPQVLAANVNLFDSGFRKSTPFTGAGTITGLSISGTAFDRVYAVVFTATNTFDVVTYERATGTFATLLSGQTVPQGGTRAVALTGISFNVNDTGTDFANGDRFYMEVIPPAPSYTKNLPFDVSFENLGPSPSTFPATRTIANTPLVWGRQVVMEAALSGAGWNLGAAMPQYGRVATVDMDVLTTLARRDYVVIDYGSPYEEILRIGRIQTTDDVTGASLGTADRLHFTTVTRFPHSASATIQEVTLANRREGVDYIVPDPGTGSLQLLPTATAWTSTANRVVVNYRTDLRFGRRRFPGDVLQDAALDAPADTDDVDQSSGDWKGLPYLDGTYTVGFWINRDYTASGNLPTAPTGESTSYRMISPPATLDFLYGSSSTTITPRALVENPEACNSCHGDVTAHGNGRRGLETCLMCHTVPGLEDGPRFTLGAGTNPDFDAYAASFVPASPGVTMDFRQLIHKVHMGKDLTNAAQYEVVGVFLGVPYGVTYEEVGFPSTRGGASDCAKCHGNNSSWRSPAERVHPQATTPTRAWRAACASCHDSSATVAHIDSQTTPTGVESCAVCHGAGRVEDVMKVHLGH